MPITYELDGPEHRFVQDQLATGRYQTVAEVMRDALRLLADRERRLLAVDEGIERGLADAEAGRTYELDVVFDELDKELDALNTHTAG